MSKQQRKPSQTYRDRDEDGRSHHFKVQKKHQDKRMMRDLEKVLKSRDYNKIINYDVY